ncbi:hypothetical protein O3M35_007098 [Rhynocoris fuscipes]|uniref:Uncharacterized protein n=1 Tax=Rhynocoris fuscipes TaxID=488301 RepID=A0AAW1DBQ9_9HEMI
MEVIKLFMRNEIIYSCTLNRVYPKDEGDNAVCYGTDCTQDREHKFSNGLRSWPDRILLTLTVNATTDLYTGVDAGVTCRLLVWPDIVYDHSPTLTKIVVKPLDKPSDAGCVQMIAGGAGSKYVALNFDSQPGKKFIFFVVIYGK